MTFIHAHLFPAQYFVGINQSAMSEETDICHDGTFRMESQTGETLVVSSG